MAGTDNHSCAKKKCKGEKLKGMTIKCSKCNEIFYLDCVITEDGLCELALEIKLIKTVDGELKSNVTEETKEKFNSIFKTDSLVKFACKICKSEGKTNERMKNIEKENGEKEEEIERLKEKLSDECKTVLELNKQNEDLNDILRQNKQLIQELTDKNDEPEEWIENDKNMELSMHNIKKMWDGTIEKVMKSEINKMTDKLNERMESGWKRMERAIMKQTETGGKNNNTRNTKTNETSERTPRNVTFYMNNTTPKSSMQRNEKENTAEQNENNTKFNENLKPAKQTQHKENKTYEIYVGKFEYGTTIEYIEQHIMNNTTIISPETFNVEEIMSKNNVRKPNYIAFKITTLKHDLYEQILNIWKPHFHARDFGPPPNERTKTQGDTNEYRVEQTRQNRYEDAEKRYGTQRTPFTNTNTNHHAGYKRTQQQQYTPRRYEMRNRFEREKTPKQYNYERENTPRHYNERRERTPKWQNNYERRESTPRRNTYEREHTRNNFLERNNQTQQSQHAKYQRYN